MEEVIRGCNVVIVIIRYSAVIAVNEHPFNESHRTYEGYWLLTQTLSQRYPE